MALGTDRAGLYPMRKVLVDMKQAPGTEILKLRKRFLPETSDLCKRECIEESHREPHSLKTMMNTHYL